MYRTNKKTYAFLRLSRTWRCIQDYFVKVPGMRQGGLYRT